jgi:hypothetical protein
MKLYWHFLWTRRTTAFGYFQVVLGALAASDGIFSHRVLKFIILGNGILTACLGHYNAAQIRRTQEQASEDKKAA